MHQFNLAWQDAMIMNPWPSVPERFSFCDANFSVLWTMSPWPMFPAPGPHTEAKFLNDIRTKVLRVFLLAIYSHLYSFASSFLFIQTNAISYIFLQIIYCTL